MDKAEDAEVGSGTSSKTRSAENLWALIDRAEDAEIGEGDNGNNEMVKRSPFCKKLSGLIKYLTFLYSNTNSAPLAKKWVFLIVLAMVKALS